MSSVDRARPDWDHNAAIMDSSRRSWTSTIIKAVSRLAIWYTILTVLFRCPSSPADVTDTTPKVCRPYLSLKEVTSPYVQPYYTAYAAPYVDTARPYAKTFQERVYTPGSAFAVSTYQRYGEPTVADLQTYTHDEWARFIKPRLDQAQASAWSQYETTLAPYVSRASGTVHPYVVNAQVIAINLYQTVILPGYRKAQPYAKNAYVKSYQVTTDVVLPYGKWAGETFVVFLQRRVWPQIRVAYGENVQPQLLKIRERLANYRDGKKIQAAVDEVDGSFASSDSSIYSTVEPSSTVATESSPTVSTESTASSSSSTQVPDEPGKTVQEQVSEDLDHWQSKLAKAAERGAEDLRERVTEIVSTQMDNQVYGTAKALVVQLEEATDSSLARLKQEIVAIVADLSDESTDEDEEGAKERIRSSIRDSGKAIKEAAQKLRSWRRGYNDELDVLVVSVSDSTLEVVDGIRDLGLQEIGLRWASMDGVTHKDWSRYHKLRKTVDEWRNGIQEVVTQHEDMSKAKKEAEDVESKGMSIAEDAAKELVRLKEVIVWKIDARDSSDDFSSRAMPAAAAKAAKKVGGMINDASDAIAGTTTHGVADSLASVASEGLENVASSGSSLADPAVKVASDASSKASSVASPAAKSSSSISTEAGSKASSVRSLQKSKSRPLASSASSMASEATEPASEVPSSGSASASSLASSGSSRASSASSSIIADDVRPQGEEAQKVLSDAEAASAKPFSAGDNVISSLSSKISSSSSDSLASASATIVPSASSFTAMVEDSVTDDKMKASSSLASKVSEAGDDYTDITKSAASAMSKAASAQL
ncbi:MAG: hypothetical protein M1828_000316 [Chrysothrix sp. TS-e1954]|nr:MAG: hypothetical protein M1828_000316 [Chrysothrix sp. TS-e1954]